MTKKILYSVAVERSKKLASNGKPKWYIDVSYLHATDITEARFMYNAGNSEEIMNYQTFKATGGRRVKLPMKKVIGIAPAVYILEDQETGELQSDTI